MTKVMRRDLWHPQKSIPIVCEELSTYALSMPMLDFVSPNVLCTERKRSQGFASTVKASRHNHSRGPTEAERADNSPTPRVSKPAPLPLLLDPDRQLTFCWGITQSTLWKYSRDMICVSTVVRFSRTSSTTRRIVILISVHIWSAPHIPTKRSPWSYGESRLKCCPVSHALGWSQVHRPPREMWSSPKRVPAAPSPSVLQIKGCLAYYFGAHWKRLVGAPPLLSLPSIF